MAPQTQLRRRMSVLPGHRQVGRMAPADDTQWNRSRHSALRFQGERFLGVSAGVKIQLTGCGLLMSTHSALLVSVHSRRGV